MFIGCDKGVNDSGWSWNLLLVQCTLIASYLHHRTLEITVSWIFSPLPPSDVCYCGIHISIQLFGGSTHMHSSVLFCYCLLKLLTFISWKATTIGQLSYICKTVYKNPRRFKGFLLKHRQLFTGTLVYSLELWKHTFGALPCHVCCINLVFIVHWKFVEWINENIKYWMCLSSETQNVEANCFSPSLNSCMEVRTEVGKKERGKGNKNTLHPVLT